MELRIDTIKPQSEITFNFEELKTEIQAKAEEYKSLVYTDKEIKEAKADVANLRKLKTAIDDEKKRIKKECLKPYENFEKKVKELISIIDEPITAISAQIVQYEDDRKNAKREEISAYWLELTEAGKVPKGITLIQLADEKWLNATVKMSAITKEIDDRLNEINMNLETLSKLPEFGFEASEVYKSTLDMSKAILEGQRLSEMQKRKVEAEMQKAESEIVKEVATIIEETTSEPVTRLTFWADLTISQAKKLNEFFINNGITFGKVG